MQTKTNTFTGWILLALLGVTVSTGVLLGWRMTYANAPHRQLESELPKIYFLDEVAEEAARAQGETATQLARN